MSDYEDEYEYEDAYEDTYEDREYSDGCRNCLADITSQFGNVTNSEIYSESGESVDESRGSDSSQLDDTPSAALSNQILDDITDAWDDNDQNNSNTESNSSSYSARSSDPNLCALVSKLNLKGDASKNEKHPLGMTIPEIYTSMQLNVNEVPNENLQYKCQLCQQISPNKKSFYDHILNHTISDFMEK